uniref:Uncharacterized protein n=1 Tax=Kwoniella dejecticola CBS 10117 TaxID=1296121 RepID=A0A1A6AGG0_9TREE|nr:uncharacterized protein I303_00987 [Kwoniella dejecticola CBS 10117]OBR89164.1 hypothetical protein I303_00987 [Kwoniella dejecticola CBS 10117]
MTWIVDQEGKCQQPTPSLSRRPRHLRTSSSCKIVVADENEEEDSEGDGDEDSSIPNQNIQSEEMRNIQILHQLCAFEYIFQEFFALLDGLVKPAIRATFRLYYDRKELFVNPTTRLPAKRDDNKHVLNYMITRITQSQRDLKGNLIPEFWLEKIESNFLSALSNTQLHLRSIPKFDNQVGLFARPAPPTLLSTLHRSTIDRRPPTRPKSRSSTRIRNGFPGKDKLITATKKIDISLKGVEFVLFSFPENVDNVQALGFNDAMTFQEDFRGKPAICLGLGLARCINNYGNRLIAGGQLFAFYSEEFARKQCQCPITRYHGPPRRSPSIGLPNVHNVQALSQNHVHSRANASESNEIRTPHPDVNLIPNVALRSRSFTPAISMDTRSRAEIRIFAAESSVSGRKSSRQVADAREIVPLSPLSDLGRAAAIVDFRSKRKAYSDPDDPHEQENPLTIHNHKSLVRAAYPSPPNSIISKQKKRGRVIDSPDSTDGQPITSTSVSRQIVFEKIPGVRPGLAYIDPIIIDDSDAEEDIDHRANLDVPNMREIEIEIEDEDIDVNVDATSETSDHARRTDVFSETELAHVEEWEEMVLTWESEMPRLLRTQSDRSISVADCDGTEREVSNQLGVADSPDGELDEDDDAIQFVKLVRKSDSHSRSVDVTPPSVLSVARAISPIFSRAEIDVSRLQVREKDIEACKTYLPKVGRSLARLEREFNTPKRLYKSPKTEYPIWLTLMFGSQGKEGLDLERIVLGIGLGIGVGVGRQQNRRIGGHLTTDYGDRSLLSIADDDERRFEWEERGTWEQR